MANLDLVISFDTTGSMSRVISEVKKCVKDLTSRLVADIGNIRVGIIAHGDYGDTPYVTKILDFTNDNHILDDFITNVEATSGGDFEECYELVLREARTKLTWRPDSRKRLIMIGDATPHDVKSPRNIHKIDWKTEVSLLKTDLHCSIYAVKAYEGNKVEATAFWKQLANLSGGKYLMLNQFSSIFAILLGICYHEHGVEALDAFEAEMRTAVPVLAPDVDGMFAALRTTTSGGTTASTVTAPHDSGATRKRKCPATIAAAAAAVPSPAKKRRAVPRLKKLMENRKRREGVANCHFVKDSGTRWSKWMVVATAQKMSPHSNWSRTEDGVSWRTRIPVRRSLKVDSTSSVVVHYELAVQCALGGRRVPVFSTFMKHSSPAEAGSVTRIWMRRTRFQALRQQVKRVTQKGLRVFMRSAKSSSVPVKRLQTQLKKKFSYAWNSGRPLRVGAASVSYRSQPQL